ncbi:glycosyltransferase [Candidatus Saganbacteria bacterium]|nr:glycosyltransferase [Candidatus Saganbacteria bacterium]
MFVESLLEIIKRRQNVVLVILDNDSESEIQAYLKNLQHPQVIIEFLGRNMGKARATNNYITHHFDKNALPATVWSMDPDILLDPASFDYLVEAIQNLPEIKVLGPRYKKNECNPEMNVWFPAKNIKGKNEKTYRVVFPFLCCVAGPILVMTGQTMRDLFNFRFFPTDNYLLYGNDDTAIYLELRRRRLKSGYLNGACGNHLKSDDKRVAEFKQWTRK